MLPPVCIHLRRDITMTSELFAKGLKIRTEVLGEAYVHKALASMDDFTKPLQELVTEYCWGAVWGRKELDRRTRSCITIAMLALLNRPIELQTHIRGGMRNGCTKVEIREILLQVAIYAGVPASNDSFRAAREVFDIMDAEAKAASKDPINE